MPKYADFAFIEINHLVSHILPAKQVGKDIYSANIEKIIKDSLRITIIIPLKI